MDLESRLFGAWIITYFVSRLILRVPNPLRKAWGITLAHAISLALITALLLGLRGTAHASGVDQLLLFIPPQIFWWLLDLLRGHKVAVLNIGTRIKGPSATARSARSRRPPPPR